MNTNEQENITSEAINATNIHAVSIGAVRAKRRSISLPLPPEEATEVLKTALSLADKGIKVFACGANRKPLSAIGWHSATTKKSEVEELFRDGKAVLGLRPSDADLVVLDIPAERVAEPLVLALPKTLGVRTMNGGLQLYYSSPEKLCVGLADFRGLRVIHEQGHVLTYGNPGTASSIPRLQ